LRRKKIKKITIALILFQLIGCTKQPTIITKAEQPKKRIEATQTETKKISSLERCWYSQTETTRRVIAIAVWVGLFIFGGCLLTYICKKYYVPFEVKIAKYTPEYLKKIIPTEAMDRINKQNAIAEHLYKRMKDPNKLEHYLIQQLKIGSDAAERLLELEAEAKRNETEIIQEAIRLLQARAGVEMIKRCQDELTLENEGITLKIALGRVFELDRTKYNNIIRASLSKDEIANIVNDEYITAQALRDKFTKIDLNDLGKSINELKNAIDSSIEKKELNPANKDFKFELGRNILFNSITLQILEFMNNYYIETNKRATVRLKMLTRNELLEILR
jgi:hypothetical protein